VGRIALIRQIATESLLLSLTGGVIAAGVTAGVVKLFKVIGGHAIPRLDTVTIGWPVLLFGLGAAVLSAVLAGLYPALRASRLDPAESLKSAGPKSSASRAERRVLAGVTMAQTALTLALLVGAGLLIRTMINLSQVQTGYDTSHILSMTVTAVQGDWAAFHHRALERVSAIPGVQHAAFAWGVPLTGNNWPVPVEIEGQPVPMKASDRVTLPFRAVTPDFFQLMGFKLSDGRGFRDTDIRNQLQVAVVNQAFVDHYFPHGPDLGRRFWMGSRQRQDGKPNPGGEIVGVVANARTDDLTQAAEPEIYLCFWQASAFSKDLVVRTAGDPRAVMANVQRELHAVDPRCGECQNLRPDSRRFPGFAHLRDEFAGGLLGGGRRTDAGGVVRHSVALGDFTPPRTGHSDRGRRRTTAHSPAGLWRRVPADRRWRGDRPRHCTALIAGAENVPLRSGAHRSADLDHSRRGLRLGGDAGVLGAYSPCRQGGSARRRSGTSDGG
jgi:MacB-like periplasmic core domain